MSQILIECVPNFSEGRDQSVLDAISEAVRSVEGVSLLDVDPGKATNRTVFTFVGHPDAVVEAAFEAIAVAGRLIDMSKHIGAHPRMGATDVCPLIPISGISIEELVPYAHKLGKRVAEELGVPVYLYEAAATSPQRKSLGDIRSGEYEGLAVKIKDPVWAPDYGKAEFNAYSGATVIGVRDFLVAYNINLNSSSVKKANAIAFEVREQGRILKKQGETVIDKNGEPVRQPGKLKSVKGIGWYIEEYGVAQISMNLTNINVTPLHIAFDACVESAQQRGIRVTGSEIVGMVPKRVLVEAGRYFLEKQKASAGLSERELMKLAVKTLGLEEFAPYPLDKKIIEYAIAKPQDSALTDLTVSGYADLTASESPAPGGGSASAAVGAFGTALGVMVANLTSSKKGYEKHWKMYSDYAVQGQDIKQRLLRLVDEDTQAYNGIIDAVRLPKATDEEIAIRNKAMVEATRHAIEVPFRAMETAAEAIPLIAAMVEKGNPNSVSDAAVGGLCLRTAITGAYYNVRINMKDFEDKPYADAMAAKAGKLFNEAMTRLDRIEGMIEEHF
ncbi:MAG TPA: glutamate formimidoyltransferase [Saprospiraceae bacterium]|jgi:glutamate formiminotransferase/formiminotetrahydrofolate cyclodeaminase|nr:MAG: glutamate formimidoyltransferase [Candidatus Parvibacillus calidus]WKZ61806.1 MAG: glutamate formimidoyltransferase [Saprospiraceae bacterium]HRN34123.1 glutamate formimidoyltransferase [Saprospiraceae bacterium]HRP84696.1 glutamate formimidoyltransferase [Saprospiraceae bacterium]